MKLLDGKVAIITGASRGIGKGIATLFAQQGAHVAFTYASSDEKARALEQELGAYGTKIKGFKSDAADFDAAQSLVDAVVAEFGTVSEEQWDEVIRVNLKSVFNLSKAVIKPMMKAKSGSIINMSSVVGVKGNAGQANYAASKAGIIGFTKSMAAEMGSRNIRCNAIAPGFIETEMTGALAEDVVQKWRDTIPLKRGGSTEDVANATLFLACEMSAYVTGQTLHVCGGMLM
jgi:3-oxoacyl-[acyl-carrier protein] reductase